MNFCSQCGAAVRLRIPPGDDRPRFSCDSCGAIHYQNPKVVVGCLPEWQDKLLLCKRAIEPRLGWWTLPAGYLEIGETVAEGARRETLEEAGADVLGIVPYGLYNIRHIGQIYLMFRAELAEPRFKPGRESLEVRLFGEEEIPWERLAFPVIGESLRRYFQDRSRGIFAFHTGNIERRIGQPAGEKPASGRPPTDQPS